MRGLLVVTLSCLSWLANGKQINWMDLVEVYTHDCDDCGMSVGGNIYLEVCSSDNECCKTDELDNPFKDDFDPGTTSRFTSDILGDCWEFDLGQTQDDVGMTIEHKGEFKSQVNFFKGVALSWKWT